MTASKLILNASSGAGGGAGLDVDEVFNTFLYNGNGVGNSIENGMNLGNDTEERVLLNLSGDTLTDTGPNTLTVNNNSVSVNTSTKKYGTGSLRFNGSATATVTDPTLILGTSDFTIEFWLYLDSLSLKGILNIGNPSDHTDYSIGMYVNSNGAITVQYRNTPNNMGQFSTSAATANMSAATWHHVAIVRHNNTLSAYLDGSVVGTDDISETTVGWNQLELGTHWGTSGGDDYRFTGYIDDFRISKKAVYTANFTAPSSAHSTSYTSTTGEGGLVWIKKRSNATSHCLSDTERGVNLQVRTDVVGAEANSTQRLTGFNSNGFTIGLNTLVNSSGEDYVSWTFSKVPKFFDVVTYTGDGNDGRTISHNLGSTPGMITVARRDSTNYWRTWHRSQTGKYANLYETGAFASDSASNGVFNNYSGNDSTFTAGININANNATYVAYLFAHNNNDGEFGPDGNADIIKCGSYTGNGGTTETGSPLAAIDLGFEPQWLMIKRATSNGNWLLIDTMRGFDVNITNKPKLLANESDAEAASDSKVPLTNSGFKIEDTAGDINASGSTYIYMAIRRGPLAEPESATDVFEPVAYTGDDRTLGSGVKGRVIGNIDRADLVLVDDRNNDSLLTGYGSIVFDRLRGESLALRTNGTNSDSSGWGNTYFNLDQSGGWRGGDNNNTYFNNGSSDYISWTWKRAPSYFDMVAYSGNGTAGRTVSHNLGVVPEMMWVKLRNSTDYFQVYHKDLAATEYLEFRTNGKTSSNGTLRWNSTRPTDSVFSLGTHSSVNGSSNTYIAYLFATVAGVSKVGSFSHTNGSTTNVDCGFSSGARFVLIKRTDASDNWYVWDTERGIVAGTEGRLSLNSTDAEYTLADDIDPLSSGFTIASGVNTGSYIFYAIA